MSLIMKFKSIEDREKFLALVRRAKPDLVGKLASSPLLPHLHAHTDAKSDAWLRKQIGPFGEAFEDLQFKTFASEGARVRGDVRRWSHPRRKSTWSSLKPPKVSACLHQAAVEIFIVSRCSFQLTGVPSAAIDARRCHRRKTPLAARALRLTATPGYSPRVNSRR